MSYIRSLIQRVRINTGYSKKYDIMYSVPKSSVLGPSLFNIDLIDLFLECEYDNINCYAINTTPFTCAEDMSSVINEITKFFFGWYEKNHMKTKPGKSHNLLSAI